MIPILEAKQVSKSYGVYQALKDVSLKFYEGETVSIVGPNGAGKTTFVNVLTGLLKRLRVMSIFLVNPLQALALSNYRNMAWLEHFN